MKRKELTAMLLAVTVALTACGGAAAQGGVAPADGEQAGSAQTTKEDLNGNPAEAASEAETGESGGALL